MFAITVKKTTKKQVPLFTNYAYEKWFYLSIISCVKTLFTREDIE